jgi:5-methylcytosine-specific restriction endonuclease McrA
VATGSVSSKTKHKKRRMCYERQEGLCYYCSKKLQLTHSKRNNFATIEHLLQISYGGTWRNDNIAVACKPCNNKRGAANHAADNMEKNIRKLVLQKYDRDTKVALALANLERSIRKFVKRRRKRGKL